MRRKTVFKRVISFLFAIAVAVSSVTAVYADTVVNSRDSLQTYITSDGEIHIPTVNTGEYIYTLPETLPSELSSYRYQLSFVAFINSNVGFALVANGSNTLPSLNISLTQFVSSNYYDGKTGYGYYIMNFSSSFVYDGSAYFFYNGQWVDLPSSTNSVYIEMIVSSTEDIVSNGRKWIGATPYEKGRIGEGTGFFFEGQKGNNLGIVETITEGFTSTVKGLAVGVVNVFNEIAIDEDGSLSNFAIWAIVFTGIAFASAVIWLIVKKVG